jgi:hypothetical protein
MVENEQITEELFFQFLKQLEALPWFENLGQPNAWDTEVKRIYSWAEWPGPFQPGVAALNEKCAPMWREHLFSGFTTKQERYGMEALWEEFQQAVIKQAAVKVPYDPDQDYHHAPTTCVWMAAWMAALVGCYYCTQRTVPLEVQAFWRWYQRGHWPCGYARQPRGKRPGKLLVY